MGSLKPFMRDSVQFNSVAQLCPTLCNPINRSTPGIPVHHQFPESTQTHAHWVSDAIQPSLPLSSPSPPAFNLSQHQGLFKWVALRIWWPKYWSFSFNISPSNEHPGLISFRMDWLDLLAVRHSQNNYGKRRRHHVPKWTSENWYPPDRKRTDVSWKSLVITLTATIVDHLPQTKHPVKSSPCFVSLNLPGSRDV